MRDGTLHRQNRQKKSRNQWRQLSRACRTKWVLSDRTVGGVGAKWGARRRATPKLALAWSLFAFFLLPPACMQHGGTLFWLTATPRRSTSPILYLCLCQSWGFPRKLSIVSTLRYILTSPLSSAMIKGNASYCFRAGERPKLTLPQCNVGDHYRAPFSQILQFAWAVGSRYNGRSARNWRI